MEAGVEGIDATGGTGIDAPVDGDAGLGVEADVGEVALVVGEGDQAIVGEAVGMRGVGHGQSPHGRERVADAQLLLRAAEQPVVGEDEEAVGARSRGKDGDVADEGEALGGGQVAKTALAPDEEAVVERGEEEAARGRGGREGRDERVGDGGGRGVVELQLALLPAQLLQAVAYADIDPGTVVANRREVLAGLRRDLEVPGEERVEEVGGVDGGGEDAVATVGIVERAVGDHHEAHVGGSAREVLDLDGGLLADALAKQVGTDEVVDEGAVVAGVAHVADVAEEVLVVADAQEGVLRDQQRLAAGGVVGDHVVAERAHGPGEGRAARREAVGNLVVGEKLHRRAVEEIVHPRGGLVEAGVGRMGEARLAHQSPVGQQGLDTVAAEGEERVAAEREGGAVGPQQQVGLAPPRVDGEYARGTGADQVSIVQRADVADDQGAEGALARLYLPGGVERLHRVVGGEEEEAVAGGDVETRGVLVEVIDGVVGATAGLGKGILAAQDERVALQLAADDAHVARAHPEGRTVVGLDGGVGRLVAQDLVDAVEGGEPAARRPLVGIVGVDHAVLRADIEKVRQRRVGGDGGQRLVEEQLVGVEGRRILAVAGHDRDQKEGETQGAQQGAAVDTSTHRCGG